MCLDRQNRKQDTSEPLVKTEEKGKAKKHGAEDKQGLFVEFIQFLIKIGMFNEQVVMSMLSNKELFL